MTTKVTSSGEEVLSSRIERLKESVKELPKSPGVYLMKSRVEKIIYVGKAKDLRSRVRSYFGSSKNLSPKTILLVGQIHSFDYILTSSEVEAFLLEASLIKKHRPRYNIRLKDDKSYPYIRMSLKDNFPRLYIARKVKKDSSMYFGPYTSGWAVHETMRFLNKTYMIRDCKDSFFKTRKRPCMTHQIGRCSAPCVDLISKKEYSKDIQSAVDFLEGKDKKVIRDLTKEMKSLAKEERFEAAARVRDNIQSITSVLEKQSVVNANSMIHQDIISYFGDERGTLIETLHVRAGKVIGSRPHFIGSLNTRSESEDVRDWLVSFINQYYLENIIPDELLLPVDLGKDLQLLLQKVLEQRSERPVSVRFSTDSIDRKLMQMADENAKSHFQRQVAKSEEKKRGLEMIQKKLHLKELPFRIECFDVSTFQGKETVASQVVFEEGVPLTSDYRRYKIKTVEGTDDFASMKEVLQRRFEHHEYEDPNLIVVDGGKGQLNVAVEILKEIDRQDVPIVGLAKARTQRGFEEQEVTTSQERFFLPGRQNPVVFASGSQAYQILVGIRDEAHRFAITYHRKLREGSTIESQLDQIHGIGQARKKVLLQHFETIQKIRQASAAEIASLEGFNQKFAEKLLQQLLDEE